MKNILVIGIGRFGYHLIDQLNKAGDQILAVDASEERLEPVLGMVTSSLIGDATNDFRKISRRRKLRRLLRCHR